MLGYLIENFLFKAKYNNYDSVLGFGKYEGKTVKQIVEIDKNYIEFCIRELDIFYLNPGIIIDILNSGYAFSNDTTANYKLKLCDFNAAVWLHNMHDQEREEYENSHQDDDWGDANSNPFYDDDLDMDQQSQEFWDNI